MYIRALAGMDPAPSTNHCLPYISAAIWPMALPPNSPSSAEMLLTM